MTKIFRIDWYPHQAYADYSRLTAEEIGVMTQIINLIYINQGPIENDPKWISRSIADMGSAKCRNIIQKLIDDNHLLIGNDGKISKKMCENQLKTVEKRREFYSEIGEKGGKSKGKSKEKQTHSESVTTSNSSSNSNYNPLTPKGDDDKKPNDEPQIKVPEIIDGDLWLKWIQHRQEIRKKLTRTQAEAQIKKLTKWKEQGHDPNEIIRNSISNGWQGLFEPKPGDSGSAPKPGTAEYNKQQLQSWVDS